MIVHEIANFITVLATATGISALIGFLYASGLRLWSEGGLDADGNAHLMHRVGSVVCFSACVFVVLFALWLMIPAFH